jgi:catechol 2,3-dioxygenase-like lactoylglutathione lyase family enzyme
MANGSPTVIPVSKELVSCRATVIIGGSIDNESKAETVTPYGRPSTKVVTTETGAATLRMAALKSDSTVTPAAPVMSHHHACIGSSPSRRCERYGGDPEPDQYKHVTRLRSRPMGVRWYTTVIDCRDVKAQAQWWAKALGWAVAVDLPDEIVLVPPHALAKGDSIPVEERGPGLTFVSVPEGKHAKNRLHLDLAPRAHDDQEAEVRRLEALGARRVNVGQPEDARFVVLADPEGNEFCVLSPRD